MRRILGALVCIAIASVAGAQAGTSSDAASAPKLPPAVEAAVNRIADSARTRGLPTDPLYAKAAEGVLKGADASRILDAVRGLAHDLDGARQALGTAASTAELVAAASLLHAGMTPAQLTRLTRAAGDRPNPDQLVMPFVVLADLVARHVSADVALSSIESLVSRGAPDAQFANLRVAVERDIASGQRPDAAVQTRSAAVLRTLEPRPGARPPN
jgi:hypothetical protein